MGDENNSRRFLYLTVQEASGKQNDGTVWDPSFINGFVRVEVRGGAKTLKVNTQTKTVQNNTLTWKQELEVEITEDAKELRIILCKEKPREGDGGSGRKSTSIVAACGIFVKDILEAVPIDKYFELFKPGAEGDLGGKIRITLKSESAAGAAGRERRGLSAGVAAAVQQRVDAYEHESDEPEDGGSGGTRWVFLAGVAGALIIAKVLASRSKRA